MTGWSSQGYTAKGTSVFEMSDAVMRRWGKWKEERKGRRRRQGSCEDGRRCRTVMGQQGS